MKRVIYFFSIAFVLLFAVLILANPKIGVNAVSNGLVLCARVIIPSLYPFTFCVLFILNSGILNAFRFLDRFTIKAFNLPFELFLIFVLSLIGGYPLGAKLINDTVTDKATARTMLNFCVNAGPAFIITAVGSNIFASPKIGVLLFTAHIIPSFILLLLFRKKLNFTEHPSQRHIPLADNFVISATSAASALINICAFCLLFSIICAYANTCAILKPLSTLLEVTNGVYATRNLLLISFLLGFGGICVWCQVISVCKNAKPNILKFAICRIFHGTVSLAISYLGIKLFAINVPTVSNGQSFSYSPFTDTACVGVSLIIMGIVLIISLKNKNYAGNMLEDIV